MLFKDPTTVVVISRLIDARKRMGLSQGEAARYLGVHRPTISMIESMKQTLSVEMLLRMCGVYGLNAIDILRTGDDLNCSLRRQMDREARGEQ